MQQNAQETLYLWFPQWQGSGMTNDVYVGATQMRDFLTPPIVFTDVCVPRIQTLELEHGVWGYRPLLHQLHHVQRLLHAAQPTHIRMIGGDCGTELAPIAFLNQQYQADLAVLWIDAHADLNTPTSSPSHTFHGMVLRTLLGDGPTAMVNCVPSLLTPNQIFLVGTRDLDPPEQTYIEDTHLCLFPPAEVQLAPHTIIDAVVDAGFTHLYVHLDLDVLDPQVFPSVKVPTPNGLQPQDIQMLIAVAQQRVQPVGMSIVEYAPSGAANDVLLGDLLNIYKQQ